MQRIIGSEKDRLRALGECADIYVINRENTEWLVKHYAGRKMPFDMLVLDELSSFKNYRSSASWRSKVISQFTRVVGLTGTPSQLPRRAVAGVFLDKGASGQNCTHLPGSVLYHSQQLAPV